MKDLKKYALITIGFTLFAVVGLTITAGPIIAQQAVKAALIRNVDERGRIPYQQTILGADGITLPAVPAGKRLVIENVSFQTISATITGGYARMAAGNAVNAFPLTFVGNRPGVGNFNVGSFPTRAYVDPTDTVQFFGENGFGSLSFFEIAVTGYIIECSTVNPCQPKVP